MMNRHRDSYNFDSHYRANAKDNPPACKINVAFEGDSESMPPRVNTVSSISDLVDSETYGYPEEKTEVTSAERDQWANPVEFLLSCISMSVGLGNIWRFPYTAYNNGGGAFLIPYLIILFLIGKPLYFMELVLGQFSSYGQVRIWSMAPIFKGIGYGQMIGTCCVVSYYCLLMALTVYYFFGSFSKVLPWAVCDPEWSDLDFCYDSNNATAAREKAGNETKSSAEFYFLNNVLKISNDTVGLDQGLGLPDWKLTLCLLFSWLAIAITLIKGVRSSGKVAYFTAIFPYIVLITLLIKGVTLPGATNGILFFITPVWGKLLEGEVWFEAVSQCFFSLSVAFGPIIMYSSYNPFKHNVYRDALIISIMDTLTSLLAGFTIFSILGNLAHNLGKDVSTVASKGPQLAFVSYPNAISKFEYVPQLFSVLFFLMMFTLGIGSAVSLIGSIITIICDKFHKWNRAVVTVVVCIIGFLIGIVYCTPGGQYVLKLVDSFGGGFVIFLMAVAEVIGVQWVYGLNNFCRDIEFMLNIKPSWYWKICWVFVIPVGLIFILGYYFATLQPLDYDNYIYKPGAVAGGWTLAIIALLMVPIWGVHSILTRKSSSIIEKLKESIRPTQDWGPKDPVLRRDWLKLSSK